MSYVCSISSIHLINSLIKEMVKISSFRILFKKKIKEIEEDYNKIITRLEVLEQENKSLKDELAKDNEIKRLNEKIKKLNSEKSFRLPENYKEKIEKVLKEHKNFCENTKSYSCETYIFTPTEIGTIFSYKCPKCGMDLYVDSD